MGQADRTATARPELTAANIRYELADRTRAIAAGGIGAVHRLVNRLGLDREANDRLGLLKVHLPYHESDHVLNIAYNLLAGGTRLEHLQVLRNDEGSLDALGARRIPDPTTAGTSVGGSTLNASTRSRMSSTPPVPRSGSSSRPTSSGRRSLTPTARWSRRPGSARKAWTSLTRASAEDGASAASRKRQQQVVIEKKFKDIRLAQDHVADFRYQPIKCSREDRIVVFSKGSTAGGRGRCSPVNAPSPEPAPGPARPG